MILNLKDLFQEIEKIDLEVHSLEKDNLSLKKEISKYYNESNKLFEQEKIIREEIRQLKNKKLHQNNDIISLKMNLSEINSKLTLKISELKDLKESLKNFNRIFLTKKEITSQIDALEWKIQTDILNKEDEIRIINKIKILEQNLQSYDKTSLNQSKIIELKSEIGIIMLEKKSIKRDILERTNMNQELYLKLQDKIDGIKSIKIMIEQIQKKIKEIDKKIDENIFKIHFILKRRKLLKNRIDEKIIAEKEEKKVEIKKIVNEKMLKGKKITLDEFKIISNTKTD